MPTPPLARDVRFHTAEQIVAAIDRALKRVEDLKRASLVLDRRADEMVKKLDGVTPAESQGDKAVELRSKIQGCRDKAVRKWSKADNIKQKYIARLRGRLACIQTMTLPGIEIQKDIPQ